MNASGPTPHDKIKAVTVGLTHPCVSTKFRSSKAKLGDRTVWATWALSTSHRMSTGDDKGKLTWALSASHGMSTSDDKEKLLEGRTTESDETPLKPSRLSAFRHRGTKKLLGAASSLGLFWDGTMAYIVSKIWYDCFHIYLFRLDARPHCEGGGCAHLEGSWREGLLTLGLCAACATVNYASKEGILAKIPSISTVPTITGMLAGWSLGDTLVELRGELVTAYPEALCNTAINDCTTFSILATLSLTMIGGLLVVAMLPLSRAIDFGDSVWIDRLERWLETMFQLIIKSLATSLMVLWTTVLTEWEVLGIDRSGIGEVGRQLKWDVERDSAEQLQHISLVHTHIFWAAALTWAGSLLGSWFEKLEEYLGFHDNEPDELAGRIAKEISDIVQATLGWVAGCAWTDVAADLFPPTSWDPDPDARGMVVVLYNALWAAVLSIACAAFLVVTNKEGARDLRNRDDMEHAFLAGAMSFFVGWQWIVTIRGLSVNAYHSMHSQWFEDSISDFARGWECMKARVSMATPCAPSTNESSDIDSLQVLVVFMMAMALTVFFFGAKHTIINAYDQESCSKATKKLVRWMCCKKVKLRPLEA